MSPARPNCSIQNDEDIQRYLDVLRTTGSVVKARRAVRTSKSTIDRIREQDAQFAEAEEEARGEYADLLEQELFRRAYEGEETAVFNKDGDLTGYQVKKSDTLLIFALKGLMRERYGTQYAQSNVSASVNGQLDETSAAARLAAIIEAARQRRAEEELDG
jgi:hypothetical protein